MSTRSHQHVWSETPRRERRPLSGWQDVWVCQDPSCWAEKWRETDESAALRASTTRPADLLLRAQAKTLNACWGGMIAVWTVLELVALGLLGVNLPGWMLLVLFVQVFPIGIAAIWIAQREGIES